jgi:hypothetical protein
MKSGGTYEAIVAKLAEATDADAIVLIVAARGKAESEVRGSSGYAQTFAPARRSDRPRPSATRGRAVMKGPGKYDALTKLVRERAKSIGAVVLVYKGEHGSGFSVQGPVEMLTALPHVLRGIADEVERDLERGPGEPS